MLHYRYIEYRRRFHQLRCKINLISDSYLSNLPRLTMGTIHTSDNRTDFNSNGSSDLISFLKSCKGASDLKKGNQVHAQIITNGIQDNALLTRVLEIKLALMVKTSRKLKLGNLKSMKLVKQGLELLDVKEYSLSFTNNEEWTERTSKQNHKRVTMSSGTWSLEIESSAPAARLFKAAMLDWHNLGPKLLPDILSSAASIEGNGGAGSIRQLNFTSAMPVPFAKERLDFIDNEKLECKNTLIEGGGIGSKLESAFSHFKFVPKGNGLGCLVKVEATYKTLPGVVVTDEIEKAKEGVTGVIKAAEAYLAANPTAYA